MSLLFSDRSDILLCIFLLLDILKTGCYGSPNSCNFENQGDHHRSPQPAAKNQEKIRNFFEKIRKKSGKSKNGV